VKPLRLASRRGRRRPPASNATLWGVLRHALPVLLADLATDGAAAPAHGLGDLPAVAAECAEHSGARVICHTWRRRRPGAARPGSWWRPAGCAAR
jgi:hypothetical protein